MRSPLGRALGLGSAKEGVEHWWWQRITAVALVPLGLWFVILALRLIGSDLDTVRHAIGRPLSAVLTISLVIAALYHAVLGLQVVIEDYVHTQLARLGLVILLRLSTFALTVAGILAVLRMSLLP